MHVTSLKSSRAQLIENYPGINSNIANWAFIGWLSFKALSTSNSNIKKDMSIDLGNKRVNASNICHTDRLGK